MAHIFSINQGGEHKFADGTFFAKCDSIIRQINNAFEGRIDTIQFGKRLVFTGTKPIVDVTYLHSNQGLAKVEIQPLLAGDDIDDELPEEIFLKQNYPNPFNPRTIIEFGLSVPSRVTLKIYNSLGQEVAALLDGESLDDGLNEVEWNATGISSGVYFYRLEAEPAGLEQNSDGEEVPAKSVVLTKKMLLIK
ncbi:MAG: T9SS type A sorting domain-containing protein [Ignavibacteriae bacterium]|nr:T9SS type A sorting domain-containing protein [Ignavibacteriota bacterium]